MRHNFTPEELETHIRLAEPIGYAQGSPERMRGIRRNPGNRDSQIALARYYATRDAASFLMYVEYIVKNPHHTGIDKWGMDQDERDDFYRQFNNTYSLQTTNRSFIGYSESLIGFFIARLGNPSSVLDLSDGDLPNATIYRLLSLLPFLNVTEINFSQNNISIDLIKYYLATVLTDPDNIITSLSFRGCFFGAEKIIAIMQLLSHANCKVKILDLSENSVKTPGMISVIDAIKNPNCRLISLKFPDLLYTPQNHNFDIITELSPAMSSNYTLVSVSLGTEEICYDVPSIDFPTTAIGTYTTRERTIIPFIERNKRIAAWLAETETLLNASEVNTSFRSSFSALKMGASSHYNRKWKTTFLQMRDLFLNQATRLNSLDLSKDALDFLKNQSTYKSFEKKLSDIKLQSLLLYFKDRPLDEIPAILYQINELDNQYAQKLVLQFLNFLNGIRDHIALAENDMRDIYLMSFWIACLIDDEELLLHHINRIEDSLLGIERFELDFSNIPEAEYTRAHPEYQTKVVTPLMVMAKELHLPLDVSALESPPTPPMHTSSPS